MPRYAVTGLPPEAAVGLSAFFPHLNRMAASGAQQYKDGVSGFPGTKRIAVDPSQARGPLMADSPVSLALKGTVTSADAPDAFYPNLYWVLPERNYRPGLLIQMYDPTAPELTTMIPVPAVSNRQTTLKKSAALAMGITPGGASTGQIRQPVSQLVTWWNRRKGNGLPSG